MLPVVSVFFELGREAVSVPVHGVRAFRIADVLRRRGDVAAELFALDDQEHCLIAEATMRSILRPWQEIVAHRATEQAAAASA